MEIFKKGYAVLLGLAVLALLAAGCASPVQAPPAAADSPSLQIPVISPSGGRFADASKEVSITCPTPGALIFWTDDDSTPTSQSNRFTEPFRIYGTTVKIKAVAVLGTQTSAVAVATLTLNDGKSASQLGLIKGKVKLPANVTGVGLDSISIFSDDLPGAVYHPDTKGFFLIDGLNTAQAYNFYFTNQTLGPIVGAKRSLSRAVGQGPTVAIQVHEVLPAAGAGVNLNEVALKKTGRIVGKAQMYGRDGALAGDHTGIDVYVPGTSFTAKTGSTGSFVLSDIPEGVYAVRADKPGYTFKEATGLLVVSEQDNTDLQTSSFNIYYGYGTVSGSATLTDGSADGVLSDGIAVLLRNLNDANSTFNTVTGADGSYTLTNVEPGSYTAFFNKSGYTSQSVEGISVVGASVTKVGSVSLPAIGGKISGTVLIKGATDSSGTMIVAQSASGKTFSTGTQADGSYRFDPIAPGTYTLTASHAGYSTRTVTGVSLSMGGTLSAQNFLDLTPAIGSLSGVVNLEGALSFEGIAVTARKSDDASVSLSAVTDAQGTYILSDLKPGTYLVRFAKDGFLAGDGVTVTLVADGIVNAAKVVLSSSKAKLAGTAQLQGATDFAGVAILASGVAGRTYSTVTDATGRYALVGLDPDTYTVQATKDGYTTAKSDPQLLGAGASKDGVALSLTVSSRSVVGKVTLESLTVFSGTKITATNLADVQKIYSALSNNDGYFVLSGMVPGSYILSFSRENYKGVTTNAVSLATTSTVTIPDLKLDQARGGITGIARSEGRTSHAGTKVTLVGTSNVTTTAADGTYTFQVPSGNYPGGVRFERTDFETAQDTGTLTVLTDSTYGVPTATLKATHNTLQGVVDLLGTGDDSGITVALDGQTGFTATTAADGTWKLDHVPLGTVTVRFTRANTPDVTSTVVVGPADQVTVPKLDMIPNASSLKGWVKLTGMTDHAGITVTVTTENKPDLTATTNASGAFEIGNILSTGTHTVTASKAGWVSQSFTIGDFSPLEVRVVGGLLDSISLIDTTAPLATRVMINNAANLTDNPEVQVQLTVDERGSGTDRMQLKWTSAGESWAGDFGTAAWQPFVASFASTIPSSGNGDYTLHVKVKDKAGNISLEATDSITVSNQFVTLSGVLSGEKLHWTKGKGVYKVSGTMVVEEGSELLVDPGVEVRFLGNFSLAVRGTIKMRGTKADPVILTSDDSFTATQAGTGYYTPPTSGTTKGLWGGIAVQGANTSLDGFRYGSGSIIEHVKFSYASTAVSGGMLVRNCLFDDTNSSISTSGLFINNEVQCNYSGSGGYMTGGGINSGAYNNLFRVGTRTGSTQNVNVGYISSNNTIDGTGRSSVSLSGNMTNSVIKEVASVSGGYMPGNGTNTSPLLSGGGNSYGPHRFNNLSDNWTKILFTASSGSSTSHDLQYNWWGADKTAELGSKPAADNYSFLYDYYDDPLNLGRVDVTNWAVKAWPLAGYRGDTFVYATLAATGTLASTNPMSYSESGDGHLKLSLKVLTENPGARIRIGQDPRTLDSAPWQSYSETMYYDADVTKAANRVLPVFCQVEDTLGNLSAMVSGQVYYDFPTVSSISGLSEGQVLNGTEALSVNATAMDYGGITSMNMLLNNRVTNSTNYSSFSSPWVVSAADLADGSYVLEIKAIDSYGRTGSRTLNFTVNKTNKPSGFGNTVSWKSDGSLIKDTGTAWLWSFDGSGAEAGGGNDLSPSGSSTAGIGSSSTAWSNLTNSAVPTSMFDNALTYEFWYKSAGSGMYSYNSGSIRAATAMSGATEYEASLSCSPYMGNTTASLGLTTGTTATNTSVSTPYGLVATTDVSWHHLALVWNGDRLVIFVDGLPVTTSSQPGKTLKMPTGMFNISFNSTYADEIRISKKARSGDELKAYVDYVRTNNLIH